MTEALSEFQQQFPVIVEIPVQWGDMDAFQHVNNTVYFRYFEVVRIAYLSRTSLFESAEPTMFPVLAETECRYKKPLTFPDTIKVGCSVPECYDKGFKQIYGIYSCTQDAVTTLGSGRIVVIDTATGQPASLHERLRAEIEKIEQNHRTETSL
jgi:acyl-CoA thioester hydrolase